MLFAAVTVLFSSFGCSGQPQAGMIAHRGFSGFYPDNTELSFEKAAKAGAAGAETDVRITKDGVYVLSHNSDADFADGTSLPIAESTFAELTAKPLKNKNTLDKVYLCTYKRYLEIMRDNGMICFIELKGEFSDEQVKEIFDIAGEVYDLSKCILQSFNFDNLVRARAIVPELPIMLTYDNDFGDYSKCFDYGFSIDAEYTSVTEEMVNDFHERGLLVAAWTANEFVSLGYCKSLGLDYIESDVFMK